MKLNLYPILKEMSVVDLAWMLVKDKRYKSYQSARNAITRHRDGKAKSVDFKLMRYLEKKFKFERNQLLID